MRTKQIVLSTQIQKASFKANIINKEALINNLKQIYLENPLQFLKHEHPQAKNTINSRSIY